MGKKNYSPYCITSGCIDSGPLSGVERLHIGGEGSAWFIPEDLLPYIRNVVNHGPAG